MVRAEKSTPRPAPANSKSPCTLPVSLRGNHLRQRRAPLRAPASLPALRRRARCALRGRARPGHLGSRRLVDPRVHPLRPGLARPPPFAAGRSETLRRLPHALGCPASRPALLSRTHATRLPPNGSGVWRRKRNPRCLRRLRSGAQGRHRRLGALAPGASRGSLAGCRVWKRNSAAVHARAWPPSNWSKRLPPSCWFRW